MYELLRNKGIQKFRENECWTYVLEDEDKFSKSGYKSAQLQMKDCMLKCAIVRFNGLLKFIYFTDGYVSLPELLSTIQPNSIWNIFSKILGSIVKVKNYGYLSCENIDIEPQNIYIDPKTLEPHLIYIPLVSEKSYSNQMNFEADLRRILTLVLRDSNNVMMADRENRLMDILNRSGHGLDEMYEEMLKETGARFSVGTTETSTQLQIMCVDKRIPINYVMEKEYMTIGRKKDNDVTIDFTNQVSRLHCSICAKNGKYYVTDENSTHGTYLNNKPCYVGEAIELHDGDRLRLPGIQLLIRIQMK